MPHTEPCVPLVLRARRMFWIHAKNIPAQYAQAQLVINNNNDITFGALNENCQTVTNSCCSTVEQAKVYHGVATWSIELQQTSKNLKILVWGDGFERSFQGFTVETSTTVTYDVVLSLTDDFVEFQTHVDHPILPVSKGPDTPRPVAVGPVGPVGQAGPVGPLTQDLLKYIIQYHLAQALGHPAPMLSNDIQPEAVNMQDPQALVNIVRCIAQELDDKNLCKILDNMNLDF
eukprot:Phypoly_transcript_14291.p1 GENE.Phypoly_transcript_14291~~Phypoly_transcript_14291.p1  ORF type:complete len:231 (+),score=27.81 Phypoly_transcript_14291:234-926(+)